MIGKIKIKKKLYTFLIISFIFLLSIQNVEGTQRNRSVRGNHTSDQVPGDGRWTRFNFPRNNSIDFKSNVDVNLTLDINEQLNYRKIRININTSSSVLLTIENKLFSDVFANSSFQKGRTKYQNSWGAIIQIQSNVSIDNLEIYAVIGINQMVQGGDKFAIYNDSTGWELIETSSDGEEISTTLTSSNTVFYLSIFNPVVDYTPEIIIVVISAVILLSISLMLSKSEYRSYIKNRLMPESQIKHRLTINEVLENKNRSKIIDIILETPGVHFNEILRQAELSPGNLVWHLDVLESYKVISKRNIGQYLVYFPYYYDSNPISNIDIELAKSKVTLKILKIIEEHPGTYANEIARTLNLDHKTVKYHVDKLTENNLVNPQKKGRKNLLYPVLEIKSGEVNEMD